MRTGITTPTKTANSMKGLMKADNKTTSIDNCNAKMKQLKKKV